jgi:hypothetical protein
MRLNRKNFEEEKLRDFEADEFQEQLVSTGNLAGSRSTFAGHI